MNSLQSFKTGVREVMPALLGFVPFGFIVGVAAVNVGFEPIEAVAMSGLVFAGAAQLAMIEILRTHGPIVIVVVTGLVVNLRYVMYSASISKYFRDETPVWKGVISAFLLDVGYAMSVAKFQENESIVKRWYYLGIAIPLWILWVSTTAAGALLGANVPASWQLEFTFPLVFLALLAPNVTSRPAILAAVVAGAVTVLLGGLPYNVGLLAGAVAGVIGGAIAEERGL